MMSDQKETHAIHKTLRLFRDIAGTVAPPPVLTVSQWADLYRRLSAESAAEPGQWDTDRAPYQRGIMDAVNDPACEDVVIMSSAQVGKTELILNIIGYYIAHDPAPMLVVQPTIEMGQTFSKDRLAPMIRDTPALSDKVRDVKSRTSGNTILHKAFPGGRVTIAGANSAASLASRPVRIVLMDEVDRYPPSAGSEGNPIKLAEKRTTAFWNRKKIKVSTPVLEATSQIYKEWLSGTMEEWNVACPICGKYQPYEWGRIRFSDATMKCKHCEEHIGEARWKQSPGKYVAEHPERHKKRSFHLNELASPWKHWPDIIEEWKEANREYKEYGDTTKLQTFINTTLGEPWKEPGKSADSDDILARREEYGAEIPDGVLVLTAAADVQDDRLEAEVVGWGQGYESWGIVYTKLYGDPREHEVWDRLEAFLGREMYFRSGAGLLIARTCLDTGYLATQCYKWIGEMEKKGGRVCGVKGMGGEGIPLIHGFSRKNIYSVPLFTLGVDSGKDLVMARLNVKEPGPNYCHFPIGRERGYDEAYVKGLNSEQKVVKMKDGRATYKWEPKTAGIRNEPLDLRNYNTAAIESLRPDFDVLEAKVQAGVNYMKKRPAKAGARKRSGVVSRGVQI
jgi:phage terminase large subunit GpA-like protein